jgi:peptide-methionine (R)-S-oxide reductase
MSQEQNMNRRDALKKTFLGAAVISAGVWVSKPLAHASGFFNDDSKALGSVAKPARFWRGKVSDNAWAVLYEENTERPNSSPLNENKKSGTYVCAACYQPLFKSAKKFESGTGWPSFFEVIINAVDTKSDRSLFMQRVEYHCSRCGGHQGHLFEDGPAPTGLRYCNNGLALAFVAEGTELPALRG